MLVMETKHHLVGNCLHGSELEGIDSQPSTSKHHDSRLLQSTVPLRPSHSPRLAQGREVGLLSKPSVFKVGFAMYIWEGKVRYSIRHWGRGVAAWTLA